MDILELFQKAVEKYPYPPPNEIVKAGVWFIYRQKILDEMKRLLKEEEERNGN